MAYTVQVTTDKKCVVFNDVDDYRFANASTFALPDKLEVLDDNVLIINASQFLTVFVEDDHGNR